jgi:site-specific DNA-methyltransferase (adenine-specific)
MEFDVIYNADCRFMEELDDKSVQLVVTSPPYNVGKKYNYYQDREPLERYLEFLMMVWRECERVLVPGGRLAINIANTGRNPYIPLHSFIIQQCLELGLLMRGEILWDKSATAGVSTAWGSFARASNPTLRDTHEYIMVFSKETMRLEEPWTRGTHTGITNQEFVDWTRSIWHKNGTAKKAIRDTARSIWRFGTQSKKLQHKTKAIAHPAPFPLDLPLRLILLYTNVDDVVLDPFMGSGSTAIAARLTQRHYIGYEISSDYVELANERIALYTSPQPYIPELGPRAAPQDAPKRKRGRPRKTSRTTSVEQGV